MKILEVSLCSVSLRMNHRNQHVENVKSIEGAAITDFYEENIYGNIYRYCEEES